MNPQKIPDDELLDDLIAARVVSGEWPTIRRYDEYSLHSHHIIYERFGTWDRAIELASERYEDAEDDWTAAAEAVGVRV